MVGTSRAVTNDSIDGESKDVYRHEEAQGNTCFTFAFLTFTLKSLNYDKSTSLSINFHNFFCTEGNFFYLVMKILDYTLASLIPSFYLSFFLFSRTELEELLRFVTLFK